MTTASFPNRRATRERGRRGICPVAAFDMSVMRATCLRRSFEMRRVVSRPNHTRPRSYRSNIDRCRTLSGPDLELNHIELDPIVQLRIWTLCQNR